MWNTKSTSTFTMYNLLCSFLDDPETPAWSLVLAVRGQLPTTTSVTAAVVTSWTLVDHLRPRGLCLWQAGLVLYMRGIIKGSVHTRRVTGTRLQVNVAGCPCSHQFHCVGCDQTTCRCDRIVTVTQPLGRVIWIRNWPVLIIAMTWHQAVCLLPRQWWDYEHFLFHCPLYENDITSRLLPAQPTIQNILHGFTAQLHRTATYNMSAMNRRNKIIRSLGD